MKNNLLIIDLMADKMTPKEVQEGKDEYMILDVREADELEEGKIDGAANIPLGQLIRKARHGDIDELKRKKIIYLLSSFLPSRVLRFVVF
jgi:rhodanese-related sulfurtransferase